jgi:putative membrane protein
MRRLTVLLTASGVLGSFTGISHAQSDEIPLPQPARFEPSSQEFIARAARADAAEIETAQLALSKSQNPAVRTFAQHMIDDHRKSLTQLRQIAAAKNAQIPDVTDLLHKVAMKTLQDKTGAEFDSAYLAQMVKDHDRAIVLFKAAADSGKVDPELKTLVSVTLPMLEQHRSDASQLEAARSGAPAAR